MKKNKMYLLLLIITITIGIIIYKQSYKIKEPKFIPFLMFHGISNDSLEDIKWTIDKETFENEMKYLKDNNYNTIFVEDINKKLKQEKNIVITFDDGYEDFYINVLPILKKYNLKANLYIITNYINKPGYLTEPQLKEIVDSKLVSIGSHTVSHSALNIKSIDQVQTELSESKKILENMLNIKIKTLAYPYGGYNDETKNIAQKYYKYALTTKPGIYNSQASNLYEIKRIGIYGTDRLEDFIIKIT